MDANSRLDRIVIGLRSGLIVMFNLVFEEDFVANVEEVELGVRLSSINSSIVSHEHDPCGENF